MATTTPELPRETYRPTGVPVRTGARITVGPSGTLSSSYTHMGTSGTGLGTALRAAISASSPGDWIVVTTKHPDTNAPLFYDGPTFAHQFALKVHSPATTTFTVLISDTAESGALVPFGIRVDPTDTLRMPTIRTNSLNEPVFYTGWTADNSIGGHYWFLSGLHLTNVTGIPINGPMVGIGTDGGRMAWLSTQVAHHIVVDRCWLQGRSDPTSYTARGILEIGHHNAVVNTYVRGFGRGSGDSQGIHIAKGIGRANYNGDVLGSNSPVHVENCLIEAEHESMNIGGDFINLNDLTENEVCDVTIRGNFITKDLARHACAGTTLWPGSGVTYDSTLGNNAKNLLEAKHGNRMHIYGNHFRNSWYAGDQKYMICFTVRPHDMNTYDGVTDTPSGPSYKNAPTFRPDPAGTYCGIRDLTFQYNVLEGARNWFQFGGSEYGTDVYYTVPDVGVGTRWDITHNLLVDNSYNTWQRPSIAGSCSAPSSGESQIGTLFLWDCSGPPTTWKGGPDYLRLSHNTWYPGTLPSETYFGFLSQPSDDNMQLHAPIGFQMKDNILGCGNRGFWSSASQQGVTGLNRNFTAGYTLQGNVFVEYGGATNTPPNGMRASTMFSNTGSAISTNNYFVKAWAQLGLTTIPADGNLMYYSSDFKLNPVNANAAAVADTDLNVNTNLLGKATDATDPGANMDLIEAYAAGVGTYDLALNMLTRGYMVGVTPAPPPVAATGTREFARVRIG